MERFIDITWLLFFSCLSISISAEQQLQHEQAPADQIQKDATRMPDLQINSPPPETQTQQAIKKRECPTDQHYDGKRCVCPQGMHWNSKGCEPHHEGCPPGQHRDGGRCICPKTMRWNGEGCEPRKQKQNSRRDGGEATPINLPAMPDDGNEATPINLP